MTNIAIYDHDNFKLRSLAFENLVNSISSCKVVYQATSLEAAISFGQHHLPDVLILITSRIEDSFKKALTKLKSLQDKVQIILLTNTVSNWIIPNLKTFGVRGYLVMATRPSSLIEGIELVTSGKMYCCSEVSSVMLGMYTQTALEFSDREKRVIKLLVDDHSSKEIAEILCISVHTVVSHRKAILKKFKVKSTAGIVRKAIESGYA